MQVAGAEILIERLIQYLSNKIQPTIYCLDSIGALGEKLQAQGAPVVVLDRKQPGVDWTLPARFAADLQQRKIQILHAHQYTPFFYSAFAKRKCDPPQPKLIFTEHGRHFPDIVHWKRRLVNKFYLSRLADEVNACSNFSARAVEKIDGFPQCKVIWNGVSLERFSVSGGEPERIELRKKLGLCMDCLLVACVARFHEVKDHSTLLRAWALVVKTYPTANLLLIGDGEEKPKLVRLIEELGIGSTVRFLGPRINVEDYLRCADVFTLTSVTEASPLTLLEAMACGCPSVITDVGGNSEHVDHGVEAMLACRGDSETIAAHISQLLRSRDLRNKIGAAARRRVEKQFSLYQCFDRYEELYKRLVRNAP
jgi:glycosyltransferase involved in cell wall biosynthesis